MKELLTEYWWVWLPHLMVGSLTQEGQTLHRTKSLHLKGTTKAISFIGHIEFDRNGIKIRLTLSQQVLLWLIYGLVCWKIGIWKTQEHGRECIQFMFMQSVPVMLWMKLACVMSWLYYVMRQSLSKQTDMAVPSGVQFWCEKVRMLHKY